MKALGGVYNGFRVVTSEVIGEQYEDWSQVRSHGRAARRRKQGHKQRIVVRFRANGTVYHDPLTNTVTMHPADYFKLQAAMETGR